MLAWKPELKDESGQLIWEGEVKLRPIKYVEKMQTLIDAGFHVSSSGSVVKSDNLLEAAMANYRVCEKVVESVQLTHKPTGTVVASLEELAEYAEGQEVLSGISAQILGGKALGKL